MSSLRLALNEEAVWAPFRESRLHRWDSRIPNRLAVSAGNVFTAVSKQAYRLAYSSMDSDRLNTIALLAYSVLSSHSFPKKIF
jgi:hypothetical protein